MAPEANCCRGIELHANRALYLTTEYEIMNSRIGPGQTPTCLANMYKLVNDASSWPKSLWVVFFSKRLNASWWKILPSHFSQVLNGVCLKGDPEDPSEQTWLTVFLTNISNVVQFRRWKCLASLSIISILFLLSSPSTCDLSFLYICTPSRFSFLSTKKKPWEEDLPIHHPQPTGKSAEVKFKEPGANINSSRFKIYRRQSLTIPNTERKNSPPLLLGGAFFLRSFDDVPPGEWRTG